VIGPRETPRLWDRHLLNCAVVVDLVPDGTAVIDLGSGAGLPGLPMALARPDLSLTLVEPLARRVVFLTRCADELGLQSVEVLRARAEELEGKLIAPVVTARAVAPLDRLAGWALPLVDNGGRMLAVKGASAAAELARCQDGVRAAGAASARIVELGTGLLDSPTVVVEVTRGRRSRPRPARRGARQ